MGDKPTQLLVYHQVWGPAAVITLPRLSHEAIIVIFLAVELISGTAFVMAYNPVPCSRSPNWCHLPTPHLRKSKEV